jgi:hypothetical protein
MTQTRAVPPAPDGVSVVLATHAGANRIRRCLESVARQVLSRDRYEVIVVHNGPPDGTGVMVQGFRQDFPDVHVRLLETRTPGAGRARNLGMDAARFASIAFLDDDDTISPSYLSGLLSLAAPDCIVVAQVADVDERSGAREFDTYLNRAAARLAGRDTTATDAPSVLALNAAKLVPTAIARAVRFCEDLRSGEDVLFWMRVAAESTLGLRFVPPNANCVYYRQVRAGSVSRRLDDYDFCVTERLAVIRGLRPFVGQDPAVATCAAALISAQLGHIEQYVHRSPRRAERVRSQIAAECPDEPVSWRQARARDLVIAYAFPPAEDTSAIVLARRIRLQGRMVDVVSQDLRGYRPEDTSTLRIVQGLVDRHICIRGRATFGNWARISEFCQRGLGAVDRLIDRKGPYQTVYSRAMWPASHLLAALVKSRYPAIQWTAEFSDPMHVNSEGTPRVSLVHEDPVADELRSVLTRLGRDSWSTNLWELVANVAYELADTVVFTNQAQRTYMLRSASDPALARRAEAKSVIAPHPTLPPEYYRMGSPLEVPTPDRVNLAYFGVLYAVRGLAEVLEGVRLLDAPDRSRLRLHLYTNQPEVLQQDVERRGLGDCVVSHAFVPYLDFLALTTRMDCLIVNDAVSGDSHAINPYLPSKVSDYLGSGTDIWSLVESGSSLSAVPTRYRSGVGDTAGARDVLRRIVADHAPAALAASAGAKTRT